LATVNLTEPVETLIKKSFSPGDKQAVARAIALLQDDDAREASKRPLGLHDAELDLYIWGFIVGNIWLAFVEHPPSEITVVHASALSHFRAKQYGFDRNG